MQDVIIIKKLVIDFHVHFPLYENLCESYYEWFVQAFPCADAYEQFRHKYSDANNFLELMNENGVDYSVVVAEVAPLTSGIAKNETIKDFCKGTPRLIPFCTFNPHTDPRMGSALEDLVLNHGFKGVKLYPTYNYFYPNDTLMYPLYSVAERLGIPVMFHTGSSVFQNSRIKYGNPIFYDDVAVDFPDLKMIMAHGGRGPWYDEAFTMVRLHKNIYIDITGLPPQKLLEYYPDLERFAHKFIFGSDWPSVNVAKNIKLISNLSIGQVGIEKILGETARQILGLP